MKTTQKREPSLKLYTALLRLYPESFRRKYEEQLLLTAADILTESKSNTAVVLATIRLYFDTIGNALKVRITQTDALKPRLRGTTARSAARSLLFALEISVISVLTFVWLLQAKDEIGNIGFYFSHADLTFSQGISQILVGFIALAYLPLTLALVARHTKLPIRLTVRWSYIFTVVGTVGLALFATILFRLFPFNALVSGSGDLPIVIFYTTMYCLGIRHFASKLTRRQPTTIA